ncbi:MAG TPA: VapC toxin family PIN domain ribonuclease [Bacteroidetes bacterium]|nr:VapC toxin family PIN domain ribonuclease [Bacteroidota bacterium]
MKRYVLDSYALLAYAEGEPGAQAVTDLFLKALNDQAELSTCVVNWGEMYYLALREGGEERATLYRSTLNKYPLELIDADEELTLHAARLKATHRISYADAFAAALARLQKAELVTGVREFKTLEKEIKILWIK